MKYIFAIGALVVAAQSSAYTWTVEKVIDGDTVIMKEQFFPTELGNLHVRLKGVDTPESGSRAKCESERTLAERAKAFTTRVLPAGTQVEVTNVKTDKYGSRLVGSITYGRSRDLSTDLINAGLAVPYQGKTKQSWCVGDPK